MDYGIILLLCCTCQTFFKSSLLSCETSYCQSIFHKIKIRGTSSLVQYTCPTNMLPATLKVSVGEVPIVICMTHEICVDKNTCLFDVAHHRSGM